MLKTMSPSEDNSLENDMGTAANGAQVSCPASGTSQPQERPPECDSDLAFPLDISHHEPHYYFGYGAMCNPISRQRRKIEGRNFRTAVLPNFRLDFSNSGVANVVEWQDNDGGCDASTTTAPPSFEISKTSFDACVHGVLMEFHDPVMWERTMASEKGYEHRKVWVYPYDHAECDGKSDSDDAPVRPKRVEPILAHVFYMTSRPEKSGVPQERYLKIISQGLEHHGASPQYIQEAIRSVECTPCRTPCDFRSFPTSQEPLATISFEKYQQRATTQPSFVIGDRIVDMVGILPDEDQAVMKFLRGNAIGKDDVTTFIRDIFYDPDMTEHCSNGNNDDDNDNENDSSTAAASMPSIWSRWAENQMVDIFSSCHVEGQVTMRLVR
jgi:hypothetical protein